MIFKFTFKNGSGESTETVEMSDCNTVEDAVNTRFGSNTADLAGCEIVGDQGKGA